MLLLNWKRFTKYNLNRIQIATLLYSPCRIWSGKYLKKTIAGFHCHTIIKTIKQKSRMKEVKEDQYSNSLTKIQVCVMFRVRDTRRNILLMS